MKSCAVVQKSSLVDYVDPGTRLAEVIRERMVGIRRRDEFMPRVILLRNHGMIAVDASVGSGLATTLMAVKAAAIFVGAAALGEIVFMPEEEVFRIYTRSDEHSGQRLLEDK